MNVNRKKYNFLKIWNKKYPLSNHRCDIRLSLVKKYIKTDFLAVIFSDVCRSTLDRSDVWVRSWVLHGNWSSTTNKTTLQRWSNISSSIVNNKIIVLLTADIGIKINADNYCKLLKLSLMKYVTAKTLNSIFIQVNIPSYSTKLNNVRFARKDYKLMEWLPASPENVWRQTPSLHGRSAVDHAAPILSKGKAESNTAWQRRCLRICQNEVEQNIGPS